MLMGSLDCPEGGGEDGGEGGTGDAAALSQAQQLQVAAHPLFPSSPTRGYQYFYYEQM
jgi:hypothetical protein